MSLPHRSADELLAAALEIADVAERAAFLERACAGDVPLREEIESLLDASAAAGTFMESPASGAPLDVAGQTTAPPTGSTAPTAVPAEQPGDRIGRFKLLERLGEGGMGVVWMAEQEQPVRRRVALKVIKVGMDTREVQARFEAERQALALMDHPNIAKVLDGGATDSGRPYFVMELVRGVRVTDYCDQHRLSTVQRLELFTYICQAVQHAHQKGIIHRDLKPSNVLVTLNDGRPVPKIIDFGIAKATDQRLTDKTLFTRFLQFLGTPAYMSPEQAELSSLDIDTRSDIYSLGVLLYELLTGRTPFDGKELLEAGLDEMRRLIREQEPPRPSTRLSALLEADLTTTAQRRQTESPKLIATVRGDLDWIVMKCLEKDRGRRYETAAALAEDLQRHLHDEPVLARPPSAAYRWRKFVRKHRAGVIVTAGFVVLLAAATVISSMLAIWARRERDRAVDARQESSEVLEFFQNNVLAAARPVGEDWGLGRKATIQQAIQAAEPEVAKSFQNRPLVEASIRQVLGWTYILLGDSRSGLQQHERAWALRKAQLPPNDPAVLEAADGVATSYDKLARYPEAIALFEAELAANRRRLGPHHPQTLWTATKLAGAYQHADRGDEAMRMLEEVARVQRDQILERTNLQAIATINALGMAYLAADRLPDAIAAFTKALAACRRGVGHKNPDTRMILNNLGIAYMENQQFAQAKPYLEEAVTEHRSVLGESHPATLNAINNLALLHLELGDSATAVTLLSNAVQVASQKLDSKDPDLVDLQASLALAYKRAGNFEKARSLFELALTWRRRHLGASHTQTLRLMDHLVDVYRALNLPDAAQKLAADAAALRAGLVVTSPGSFSASANERLTAFQRAGQLTNVEEILRQMLVEERKPENTNRLSLAGTLYRLGNCLLDQKRYREAEDTLQESLAILKQVEPGRTPAFAAQSALAAAWLGQNKQLDEAEKMLLEAHRLLERRNTNNPSATRQGLMSENARRLVQLYQTRGLPDQAALWERKQAELKQEASKQRSP